MDEPEKEEFLREFGEFYGYSNAPKTIDQIRTTEFKRLDGLVYLDHAGATLYSENQMEAIFNDFSTNVYGNPHSQSDSSSATSELVSQARRQVLDYCNASAKDYRCIFTSGATSALKLVGETFPWSAQSCFAYTMENHNSVLGIREYALDRGASAFAVDIVESVESMRITQHQLQRRNDAKFLQQEPKGVAYNLFSFPSECNFSGLRFNLDLVKKVKEESRSVFEEGSPFYNGQWMVLVDAAKGSATEPPDLSEHPADFVALSFYKIFGYPTGLGALIVRNDAAKLLKKTYFSGGTVAASIADIDLVKRRDGIENLFEDGTVSFLSIASISHGFKVLNTLTISAVTRHTNSLASYVRKVLLSLRHGNGASVCTIYGIQDPKVLCHKVGPIVSFNMKRPNGSWYGHREVEKLASLAGIQLRTGCFCNPGACAKFLGLSHDDLLSNLEAGHVCWDDYDILNGKPTGAVRVSFGYMSSYEDAKKFVDFITESFVASGDRATSFTSFKQGDEVGLPISKINVKSIVIYPIKSCGGFATQNWPLIGTGLRYDREWALTNLTGEILTQKKVPEMCFISTLVDLDQGKLFVQSPHCKIRLEIKLSPDLHKEDINVNGHRFEVMGYDNEVSTWFSNAIGRPCTLIRFSASNHKLSSKANRNTSVCRDLPSRVSFANEAQLLLISEESTSDLNKRLCSKDEHKEAQSTPIQVNPMRFRPNLVISGGEPYTEDGWRNLRIGHKYFTCLGGCNRCQMINIDYTAGCVKKSKEPLATLASYRRLKGKILFGILLRYERCDEVPNNDAWLRVGEELHPDCY